MKDLPLLLASALFLSISAAAHPSLLALNPREECEFFVERIGRFDVTGPSLELSQVYADLLRAVRIGDPQIEMREAFLSQYFLNPEVESDIVPQLTVLRKSASLLHQILENRRHSSRTSGADTHLISSIERVLRIGSLTLGELQALIARLYLGNLDHDIPRSMKTPYVDYVVTLHDFDYWLLHKWTALGAPPIQVLKPGEVKYVDEKKMKTGEFEEHDWLHAKSWDLKTRIGAVTEARSPKEKRAQWKMYLMRLLKELYFIRRTEQLEKELEPDDFLLLSILIHDLAHESGGSILFSNFNHLFNGIPSEEKFLARFESPFFLNRLRNSDTDYGVDFPYAARVGAPKIRALAQTLYSLIDESSALELSLPPLRTP